MSKRLLNALNLSHQLLSILNFLLNSPPSLGSSHLFSCCIFYHILHCRIKDDLLFLTEFYYPTYTQSRRIIKYKIKMSLNSSSRGSHEDFSGYYQVFSLCIQIKCNKYDICIGKNWDCITHATLQQLEYLYMSVKIQLYHHF